MRRQGPCRGAGRRRHRPRQLSRRRLRLRHPVADLASHSPAARRARTHAAHRPARHRVVSEFRPLEDTAAGRARRPHAADRQSALCVVGDAEYPLLQHQGFPCALPCRRRQDGTSGGAQCLGPADAAENAVVVLESVRRAGGVLAQPAGIGRFCYYSVIVATSRHAERGRYGPVAQWSELAAHNRLVGGSSPPGPTNNFLSCQLDLRIRRLYWLRVHHRFVPSKPTFHNFPEPRVASTWPLPSNSKWPKSTTASCPSGVGTTSIGRENGPAGSACCDQSRGSMRRRRRPTLWPGGAVTGFSSPNKATTTWPGHRLLAGSTANLVAAALTANSTTGRAGFGSRSCPAKIKRGCGPCCGLNAASVTGRPPTKSGQPYQAPCSTT